MYVRPMRRTLFATLLAACSAETTGIRTDGSVAVAADVEVDVTDAAVDAPDGDVAQRPCVRSGCGGTVIGRLCAPLNEEGSDTCDLRRTDFCYNTARCERQPSGACGWTMDDALRVCLAAGGPACVGPPFDRIACDAGPNVPDAPR
jgi:hypothetical protein